MRYKQPMADPCLYYSWTMTGPIIWFTWIDDCLIADNNVGVKAARADEAVVLTVMMWVN